MNILQSILQIQDYVIPEEFKRNRELYRRSNLILVTGLSAGFFTILFIIIYLFIDFPLGIAANSLGLFSCIFMILGLRRGLAPHIIGNFSAVMIVVVVGPLVITSGGITSPALPWLFMIPIAGFMFAGKPYGYFWAVFLFLAICGMLFMKISGIEGQRFYSSEWDPLLFAVNFLLTGLILGLIIYAYESEQDRSYDQLNHINRELQVKKAEVEQLNRSLENKVRERTRQLIQTNEELDHFAYSVSHNLRAPLASILGLVDIARIDVKNYDSYLQLIENSIKRLDDTVNSINSYLKNNRLNIEKKPFELLSTVRGIIDDLAYMKNAQLINFRLDIDEKTFIESDHERVRVILTNLISNSIKYADLQKQERIVDLAVYRNNSEITFNITDNGIGIEDDKKEMIFDMFYRGTEKASGDGLGLYIVKETLKRLKGSIEVKSKKGEGTTFTVTMPVS